MKRITLQVTEPRLTIEMSLSETKRLRDVLGAFAADEVRQRLREQNIDIHPNFGEWLNDVYDFFHTQVKNIEEKSY